MTERVALVVGSSSGIGRATALQLARSGHKVMAVARREDRLRELAAEDQRIEYMVGTIDSEESCREIVEGTEQALGRVDILVNSAAIGAAHETTVMQESFADWRRTITLNLDAPFHLIQHCARGMVERGWGRIVMVTSTAADKGGPRMPAYCASKHGLLGLIRAAAIDLAPFGVTCNAVGPGWVRTEMSQRLVDTMAADRGVDIEAIWAEIKAIYPGGRLATEDEVAHAIVSLTADGAGGISGEHLRVAAGSDW